MADILIPLIVAPSFFFLTGWLFWMIVQWRQYKYRMNVQLKMLDKVASGAELVQFVESDAGAKFIASMELPSVGPKDRILSAVYKAVILLVLGIAVYALRGTLDEGAVAFTILGTVLMAFGIGYIIATFISYRLASKWGMIPKEAPEEA
ncbi:MAG: hypothetical protein DRJ08_03925 [Acidobacteria bacterium]|nr:MAG: hypothetical protein DRJ08_03925 [Acidobacteriota bacterium]